MSNPKDGNQWRLQCIVQSNIEVMRNVMQMHSHAREMMFEIVGEVVRRGLKGGKMVVSEGIELKFNQEELREIVNDFLTQPDLDSFLMYDNYKVYSRKAQAPPPGDSGKFREK